MFLHLTHYVSTIISIKHSTPYSINSTRQSHHYIETETEPHPNCIPTKFKCESAVGSRQSSGCCCGVPSVILHKCCVCCVLLIIGCTRSCDIVGRVSPSSSRCCLLVTWRQGGVAIEAVKAIECHSSQVPLLPCHSFLYIDSCQKNFLPSI